jgi:hypothetical protein
MNRNYYLYNNDSKLIMLTKGSNQMLETKDSNQMLETKGSNQRLALLTLYEYGLFLGLLKYSK